MNDELLADEIRRRERARRKKGPVWTVCSFILHLALFAVIILLTPAKSLIFEPKDNKKDAAKDLSADRIEEIAEDLSDVRINELLQQILAMQAVLHNMDMMKQELAKSYDSFAEKNSKTAKEELEEFIDETERNQIAATNAQAVVRGEIAAIIEDEKRDYRTLKEVSDALRGKGERLMFQTADLTGTAQGNAVNALDKLQVRAEFVGFQKTAETAVKFLEAQSETARMQNQVQGEVNEIAWGVSEVYYNEMRNYPNATNSIARWARRKSEIAASREKNTAELAALRERQAKELPAKDAEIAELEKKREQVTAELAELKARRDRDLAAADAEIAELKKKLEAVK